MLRMKMSSIALTFLLAICTFVTGVPLALAGHPYSGSYCVQNNEIFWFIHTSDTHIGAGGTQDSSNLQWLVTQGKNAINPSFIVVSGDLTDSTNGNFFGYPDGPH